jgi:hypothetical protein
VCSTHHFKRRKPTPWRDVLRVVTLTLWPFGLVEAALKVPASRAILLGCLGWGVCTSLILGATTAPASEPFSSMTDYFLHATMLAALFSPFISSVLFPIAVLASHPRCMSVVGRDLLPVFKVGLPLTLLSAWTFIVPLLAWCAAHLWWATTDPSFGLVNKPLWTAHPIMRMAGSQESLFILMMLFLICLCILYRHLFGLGLGRPRCEECSYELEHVPTDICPECGHRNASQGT